QLVDQEQKQPDVQGAQRVRQLLALPAPQSVAEASKLLRQAEPGVMLGFDAVLLLGCTTKQVIPLGRLAGVRLAAVALLEDRLVEQAVHDALQPSVPPCEQSRAPLEQELHQTEKHEHEGVHEDHVKPPYRTLALARPNTSLYRQGERC